MSTQTGGGEGSAVSAGRRGQKGGNKQRANKNSSAAEKVEDRSCCENCEADDPHQTCSACLVAKYCSKDCQKAHWKSHKPHCKVLQQEREAATQRGKRKECCVNCQTENAVEHCSSCSSAECQKAHWKIHKPMCKQHSNPETVAIILDFKKAIKKGTGSVHIRLHLSCMLGRLAG